ncbi:hypothetical protein BbiDN127_0319 [Borreliella bissettiae DN127]|uniref:Uncharacterized protein n=1 Tax=Borrelia bissettiae (strain DSM 17990 / CIP 109136 / DN127) TaxID=521010 RepID=G0ALC7_BORBD|nr:hypothetical protein BbiDN127_0319 [Borreliella bissettiae DN127]
MLNILLNLGSKIFCQNFIIRGEMCFSGVRIINFLISFGGFIFYG